MAKPDYKTAAYVALDGMAARASVKEPHRITEIPPEKLVRYTSWIEDLVRSMIGDAFFRVLKSHEDWEESLIYYIRTIYLQGASHGSSDYERYLTDQAKAQTRGMLSGLLRASSEG